MDYYNEVDLVLDTCDLIPCKRSSDVGLTTPQFSANNTPVKKKSFRFGQDQLD